jgi:tRNA U55 pseudouridine synthase TruB
LGCGATLSELQRTRIGDYVLHPELSIDPLREKEKEKCI